MCSSTNTSKFLAGFQVSLMITNWAFQKKTFSKSFPLIISLIEFESWLGFATRAANCSWGNTFTQQSGILQFKPACNLGSADATLSPTLIDFFRVRVPSCSSKLENEELWSFEAETFTLTGKSLVSLRSISSLASPSPPPSWSAGAFFVSFGRLFAPLWPQKPFLFFLLTDLNFLFPCSTISWSTTSKNIRKKQSKFTTPRFWENRNFESSTTALHHGYCKWKSGLDPVKFGF